MAPRATNPDFAIIAGVERQGSFGVSEDRCINYGPSPISRRLRLAQTCTREPAINPPDTWGLFARLLSIPYAQAQNTSADHGPASHTDRGIHPVASARYPRSCRVLRRRVQPQGLVRLRREHWLTARGWNSNCCLVLASLARLSTWRTELEGRACLVVHPDLHRCQ